MRIVVTDEFTKRYLGLPLSIQKKVEKQERFLRENPFHPSLRTEKLEPKQKEYWSFRVDRSYRVLFRFEGPSTVILMTVGPHDWIYRLPF